MAGGVLGSRGASPTRSAPRTAQGIIHRDLKPDNVFLLVATARWPAASRGQGARLRHREADRDGNSSGSPAPRTGSLMGTPTYMSPEQCRGASRSITARDIYSLGCVLFELCGRPPFIDEARARVLEAHTVRQPPALASLVPDAPAWLERLVARMLAKDPRQRPRSMDEVSLDLSVVALVPPVTEDVCPRTNLRRRRPFRSERRRPALTFLYRRAFFARAGLPRTKSRSQQLIRVDSSN